MTGSHEFHALEPRVTLNSWYFCVYLQMAGFTDMRCHIRFIEFWGSDPELRAGWASTRLADLLPSLLPTLLFF